MDSLSGQLLVASPDLIDHNFKRTVIYVCSHGPDGALGLILNRPIYEVAVADHLRDWAGLASQPPVLFRGGPVERDAVFALGKAKNEAAAEEDHDGWIPARNGLGLVNLGSAPDVHPVGLESVRFFLGYAGWTAGQLDAEIEEGAWFTVRTQSGDAFTLQPEQLYRQVLARQNGKLAMYALFPDDPRRN